MAVVSTDIKQRAKLAALSLMEFGPVRAVYVFGSHTEARAGTWSDVDVAVFMDGVEYWDYDRIVRASMHVQNCAGFDIETHLMPAKDLALPEPGGFAHYILRHGVHVYGEMPDQI